MDTWLDTIYRNLLHVKESQIRGEQEFTRIADQFFYATTYFDFFVCYAINGSKLNTKIVKIFNLLEELSYLRVGDFYTKFFIDGRHTTYTTSNRSLKTSFVKYNYSNKNLLYLASQRYLLPIGSYLARDAKLAAEIIDSMMAQGGWFQTAYYSADPFLTELLSHLAHCRAVIQEALIAFPERVTGALHPAMSPLPSLHNDLTYDLTIENIDAYVATLVPNLRMSHYDFSIIQQFHSESALRDFACKPRLCRLYSFYDYSSRFIETINLDQIISAQNRLNLNDTMRNFNIYIQK